MFRILALSIGLILFILGVMNFDAIRNSIAHNKTATKSGRKFSSKVKVLIEKSRMSSNDLVFEAVGTGKARLSVQI